MNREKRERPFKGEMLTKDTFFEKRGQNYDKRERKWQRDIKILKSIKSQNKISRFFFSMIVIL